jgi:hypothetical protein
MKRLEMNTVVAQTMKMPGADGHNWYSGKGQDAFIHRVFERLGTTNKFCIEFGAGDGYNASNTLYLGLNGWKRLLIDFRHGDPNINLHQRKLTAENICNTFAELGAPKEFDFVSIDIDGNDYWLMDAMLKQYSPRCIMVEVNTRFDTFDLKVMKYHPDYYWDGHSWYGASPYAVKMLGEKYGYTMVWVHQDDAVLVRNDCLHPDDITIPWQEIYPKPLKEIYAGTDEHMVPENWMDATIEKKSIHLSIAHYGTSNREHLFKCLREYNSYKKYAINCDLYVTDKTIDLTEFSNLYFTLFTFEPSVGESLVLQHRKTMAANVGRFDYYVYAEDDILIKEHVFDAWVREQSKLPDEYVCGVLRYEQKEEGGYKFLFDTHETHSVHRGGSVIFKDAFDIGGKKYLEPYNIHQGCYLLTAKLFQRVLDSGRYLEHGNHYVGILEGGASDVFYKCGLTRVLPAKGIAHFLVHHCCNKYVHKLADFYTEHSTLNDEKWDKLTDTW